MSLVVEDGIEVSFKLSIFNLLQVELVLQLRFVVSQFIFVFKVLLRQVIVDILSLVQSAFQVSHFIIVVISFQLELLHSDVLILLKGLDSFFKHDSLSIHEALQLFHFHSQPIHLFIRQDHCLHDSSLTSGIPKVPHDGLVLEGSSCLPISLHDSSTVSDCLLPVVNLAHMPIVLVKILTLFLLLLLSTFCDGKVLLLGPGSLLPKLALSYSGVRKVAHGVFPHRVGPAVFVVVVSQRTILNVFVERKELFDPSFILMVILV